MTPADLIEEAIARLVLLGHDPRCGSLTSAGDSVRTAAIEHLTTAYEHLTNPQIPFGRRSPVSLAGGYGTPPSSRVRTDNTPAGGSYVDASAESPVGAA